MVKNNDTSEFSTKRLIKKKEKVFRKYGWGGWPVGQPSFWSSRRGVKFQRKFKKEVWTSFRGLGRAGLSASPPALFFVSEGGVRPKKIFRGGKEGHRGANDTYGKDSKVRGFSRGLLSLFYYED